MLHFILGTHVRDVSDFNSIEVQPMKKAKSESLKSDANTEELSPSFPLSPAADQPITGMGTKLGIPEKANSASSSINNNNNKFSEQNIEKISHPRKNNHNNSNLERPGEQFQQDNGNFSDYALLRKLFPHHDKTILLDALLSCDGSTVAAIQHLLANNIGIKNSPGQQRLSHEANSNLISHSKNDSPTLGTNSSSKKITNDLPLVSTQLNFNSQKKSNSRRRSLEANSPPLLPSLTMHGNNQISDLHTPMLHHGSPPHPLPHSTPNPNFPVSKFPSYAAAQQAQHFYAQAHQRYLAAAAAAAASALQQAHPHGVGHQINSPQSSLALPQNIGGINQAGFLAGNILSRPDFAQYLSNAAAAQHHISSSGRFGSNIGLPASNSSQSSFPSSNMLFNNSSGIPPLFQSNANSGTHKIQLKIVTYSIKS